MGLFTSVTHPKSQNHVHAGLSQDYVASPGQTGLLTERCCRALLLILQMNAVWNSHTMS